MTNRQIAQLVRERLVALGPASETDSQREIARCALAYWDDGFHASALRLLRYLRDCVTRGTAPLSWAPILDTAADWLSTLLHEEAA